MTATNATTPVELVEKIFTDMGIGPTEAQSMAGDFIVRATASPLRLGTDRSVPPSATYPDGCQMWVRNGKNGENAALDVGAEDGSVLAYHWESEYTEMSPNGARVTAAHLLAAADAADRQARQATKTTVEEA